MENYFDIITPAELREIYSEMPSSEELADIRESYAKDPDLNLQHLYWLYLERGEPQKAQVCFDQIKDESRRIDAASVVADSKI